MKTYLISIDPRSKAASLDLSEILHKAHEALPSSWIAPGSGDAASLRCRLRGILKSTKVIISEISGDWLLA